MAFPTKYTPAIVAEICERLSRGEPLTVICRSDAKFPNHGTVRDWMDSMPEVARDIARAREAGEDTLAEQCLTIADTPQEGVEITEDEEGTSTKRLDMLGHRKLQIDTRLKLLAKWNPKKWGDRQAIDHTFDAGAAERLKDARDRLAGKET